MKAATTVVLAFALLFGASVPAHAAPNIEMIPVKGGCYRMGDAFGGGHPSERPVHEVCVDDFTMGKYPVTQAQWRSVMGTNPSRFRDCGDDCPVEQVLWKDAAVFIERLNRLTGKNYRFPTEAEWEYAARSGGKNEQYAGGNRLRPLAWYSGDSGGKPHPVGLKAPNGLGIYDMSGNVWEWVKDWYDPNYYGKSPRDDPQGPDEGVLHVMRGGSWLASAWFARTSYRGILPDGFKRIDHCGLRLALSRRVEPENGKRRKSR